MCEIFKGISNVLRECLLKWNHILILKPENSHFQGLPAELHEGNCPSRSSPETPPTPLGLMTIGSGKFQLDSNQFWRSIECEDIGGVLQMAALVKGTGSQFQWWQVR